MQYFSSSELSFYFELLMTLAGASLQLVPMIMELVAPIESQKIYLMQARASRGELNFSSQLPVTNH